MLSPGRPPQSAAGATHSLATHGSSSCRWPFVATGKESLLDLFALFLTDPLSLSFCLFLSRPSLSLPSSLSFFLLFTLSLDRHCGTPQRRYMARRAKKEIIPPRTRKRNLPSCPADDESLLFGGPRDFSRANVRGRAGGRDGRKLTTGGPTGTGNRGRPGFSVFLSLSLSFFISNSSPRRPRPRRGQQHRTGVR